MAKRKNGADAEHTTEEHQNGDNVTVEVRRQFYHDALMARIGVESAQSLVKNKKAELSAVLKKAKKAGVNSKAITRVLTARLQDENDVVEQLRDELETFDFSGVVSNIKEKLLARLVVEEPTANEEAQISQDRAYDAGAFDYRSNYERSQNKFIPGTSLHDAWDRGWLASQAVTASEMTPEPPAAVQ